MDPQCTQYFRLPLKSSLHQIFNFDFLNFCQANILTEMKQSQISDFFSYQRKRKTLIEERQLLECIDYERKYIYSGQSFQQRHSPCTEDCLDFQNICYKPHQIQCHMTFCGPLPLDSCAKLIENKLEEIKKHKTLKLKKKGFRKTQKQQRRGIPLNQQQRDQIIKLQNDGFKNSVIANLLRITPGQVRMNKTIINREKCQNEIILSFEQQKWIMKECSKSSNIFVFSAQKLLKRFLGVFVSQNMTLHQFRQILHSLKICYRVPSLKPLQYFKKKDQNPEVFRFIEQICGYIKNGFHLIFIDECSIGSISRTSHKQWHVIGSFKQSLQRIGSFVSLICAIGQNDLLHFQIIEETGKGFIFKSFCQNLFLKAKEHYRGQNFVFVMDNSTIHKNELMTPLLQKIPHVFTPPYRPDLNGIEHLFSWLKQYIVKEQPFLLNAFHATVHRGLSHVTEKLIQSWIDSFYAPMMRQGKYLL